jgi:hypothetical protein
MSAALARWKDLFCRWPEGMLRRGVLVTAFDEQIPFVGFWTSETFLLIERQTPDTLGARMVVLPYENIRALKVTDVVKPKTFRALGFEGPAPKE